jgi:hypothetical protein
MLVGLDDAFPDIGFEMAEIYLRIESRRPRPGRGRRRRYLRPSCVARNEYCAV